MLTQALNLLAGASNFTEPTNPNGGGGVNPAGDVDNYIGLVVLGGLFIGLPGLFALAWGIENLVRACYQGPQRNPERAQAFCCWRWPAGAGQRNQDDSRYLLEV